MIHYSFKRWWTYHEHMKVHNPFMLLWQQKLFTCHLGRWACSWLSLKIFWKEQNKQIKRLYTSEGFDTLGRVYFYCNSSWWGGDSMVLFYGYQLKSIIFGCSNHKFLMQFSTHSYHAAENDMHANKWHQILTKNSTTK